MDLKRYETPEEVKVEIAALIRSKVRPHPKARGWYNQYVFTLEGNCKWCEGSGKVKASLSHWIPDVWGGPRVGREKGKEYKCPRCQGTGDEPLFGRVLMDMGKEPEE